MDAKCLGPYIIHKHLGKGLYFPELVSDPTHTTQRVNGAHLKPYHTPPSSPTRSDDQIYPSPSLTPQNSVDSIHNTPSHQMSDDSIPPLPPPLPPLPALPSQLLPLHSPYCTPTLSPQHTEDETYFPPSIPPQKPNSIYSIHNTPDSACDQHSNDNIPSPLPPLHSTPNKVSSHNTCSYMYKSSACHDCSFFPPKQVSE